MKKTIFTAFISTLILSSCTDNMMHNTTIIDSTITGDGTTTVIFKITPPNGFVVTDGAAGATPINYSTSFVYDTNNNQLVGDITTYCDLAIVDGNGNLISTTKTSGTTYQNANGYAQISNCNQDVKVAVNGIFNVNSKIYKINSSFPTIITP